MHVCTYVSGDILQLIVNALSATAELMRRWDTWMQIYSRASTSAAGISRCAAACLQLGYAAANILSAEDDIPLPTPTPDSMCTFQRAGAVQRQSKNKPHALGFGVCTPPAQPPIGADPEGS